MSRKIIFFLACLLALASAAYAETSMDILAPEDAKVLKVKVKPGDCVYSGREIITLKLKDGNKIHMKAGVSGKIDAVVINPYDHVKKGQVLGRMTESKIVADSTQSNGSDSLPSIGMLARNLYKSTGFAEFIRSQGVDWTIGIGRFIMILIGGLFLYLGISKGFEPLLLIPIGFGAILSNIPLAGIAEDGRDVSTLRLHIFAAASVQHREQVVGPVGQGARALVAVGHPVKIANLLAQFRDALGALALNFIPGIDFTLRDAASIGIIGGADGPTSIFVSSQLSPRLLGSIAVAAYSYMALVPVIQPPIMRLLTTEEERKIQMTQMRYVSKLEKIVFPLIVLGLCILLLPSAAPLIGCLMFGNLAKECGVIDRLSNTIQNSLINIVTIFLGLGVGSKLSADKFLNLETIGILVLGVIAFSVGTASGVLMAKVMKRFSKTPINPLIGAAGVSAVPMAARVVNKVGQDENPHNYLLMHAMGPNVSGVIGSAVAAGVLLSVL